VQVLVQAGPALNPGDDGQPWPTAWTLYQLRGADLPADPDAVLADPARALGDRIVQQDDHTAFPSTRARLVVPLAPGAGMLLAVARFRRPLTGASVRAFPVPAARPGPAPCFYLGLERSELAGGAAPPPGFDRAAFPACPPPAAPPPSDAPSPAPELPPVPSDTPPTAAPPPPAAPRLR
jgi:type VI secretion system VasD/TssJ family lipoprotein